MGRTPSPSDDETAATKLDRPAPVELDATTRTVDGAQPTASALGPGSRLGRFGIVEELGQGGMGVVYRATDDELGREVAIKILTGTGESAAGGSQELRLRREAQALARLNHPNVITIYDVGRDARGLLFVAMELVEGDDLTAWLEGAPRTRREILGAFRQAGLGLGAAHAVGLVHRDFKPSNVLVGRDGRVRVLDFGLARAAAGISGEATPDPGRDHDTDEDGTDTDTDTEAETEVDDANSETGTPSGSLLDGQLTQIGRVVGTPKYMAPEQHRGIADARSDQFAFCVSLYRALYGAPPFAGRGRDELRDAVTYGRLADPPPDADVPAWLRAVVVRGLSADPAARYPSMEALLAELDADPAPRRRRRLLAAAAVLAVGGALGGAVWLSSGAAGPPPCVGAGDLSAVWNPDRKEAIHAVFRASGLPQAEAAFSDVVRVLDHGATAWHDMAVDACRATRVRGTQSAELLDLRMACLARHRLDLEAEIDLFLHADARRIKRLAASPPQGGSLAECANAAALKAAERPPTDPAAKARLVELRRGVARTRALFDAGDFAGAVEAAGPAVAGGRALGYHPVIAEALLERARAQNAQSHDAAAQTDFDDAAVAALAGHRDDLAIDAWRNLAVTLGMRAHKYDQANLWMRYARALVDRIGDLPIERAELDRAEAELDEEQEHFADAERHAEQALALCEARDPATGKVRSPLGAAYAEKKLGEIAFARGDRAGSIPHYTRALALEEPRIGSDHPFVAAILNGRANSYSALGRLDEAAHDFEQALEIIKVRLGPTSASAIVVETNIGTLRRRQGRFDEARGLLEHVLAADRATGPKSGDVVLDLIELATIESESGHPDRGLAYSDEGAGLADAAHVDQETHGELASVRGRALELLGRTDDALAAFGEARTLLDKVLGAASPEAFEAAVGVGECQLAQHHAAEAQQTIEGAMAKAKVPELPAVDQARARYALARALVEASGPSDRARELARQAADGYRGLGHGYAALARTVDAWARSLGAP